MRRRTRKEFEAVISYDALTGEFRDKETGEIIPPEMNGNIRIQKTWYRAGRVAWILSFKKEALFTLTHKDKDPLNKKIENIVKCSKFKDGMDYDEWYNEFLKNLTKVRKPASKLVCNSKIKNAPVTPHQCKNS